MIERVRQPNLTSRFREDGDEPPVLVVAVRIADKRIQQQVPDEHIGCGADLIQGLPIRRHLYGSRTDDAHYQLHGMCGYAIAGRPRRVRRMQAYEQLVAMYKGPPIWNEAP